MVVTVIINGCCDVKSFLKNTLRYKEKFVYNEIEDSFIIIVKMRDNLNIT